MSKTVWAAAIACLVFIVLVVLLNINFFNSEEFAITDARTEHLVLEREPRGTDTFLAATEPFPYKNRQNLSANPEQVFNASTIGNDNVSIDLYSNQDYDSKSVKLTEEFLDPDNYWPTQASTEAVHNSGEFLDPDNYWPTQASTEAVHNSGEFLNPDNYWPTQASTEAVHNSGEFLNPDNYWPPQTSTEAVRNSGEFLDPDATNWN